MTSRDLVLGRVRRALADVPAAEKPSDIAVTRGYLRTHVGDATPERLAAILADHLADYRALVHRCSTAELPHLLARLLAARAARRVLVPAGLPAAWLSVTTGVEHVPEDAALTPYDLDAIDSVVTGCAVAVAETGTVVLDGAAGQGTRRATLVPDHHVCVVGPDRIVAALPEAVARLDPRRPLTWISGPSATSDIELARVEGVHGPRTLEVVITTDGPSGGR